MRFYGIALFAGAAILGACGGEKQATADSSAATSAATTTTGGDTAAATAAAGGAAPAGAAGTATAAPATGKTHEVQMVGDASGYKFVPANITVKSGDAIKYTMVSGGPHNVAFQNVADAAVLAQLDANMPGQKLGPAAGPMMMQANEAYTISFGKVPPGKYPIVCQPHAAMNMTGVVTVE